jgi:hypothetical protein
LDENKKKLDFLKIQVAPFNHSSKTLRRGIVVIAPAEQKIPGLNPGKV